MPIYCDRWGFGEKLQNLFESKAFLATNENRDFLLPNRPSSVHGQNNLEPEKNSWLLSAYILNEISYLNFWFQKKYKTGTEKQIIQIAILAWKNILLIFQNIFQITTNLNRDVCRRVRHLS